MNAAAVRGPAPFGPYAPCIWAPSARAVYRWWGTAPRAYDAALFAGFLGQIPSLRRRAVDAIGVEAGHRVLDLACGTGVNLPPLLEKLGRAGSIVAVDQSPEMLAAARERVGGDARVELIEVDVAVDALPVTDVDGAICTLGLSAIGDHEAAIRQVSEALRPGGRFVVVDASPYAGVFRALNPARDVLFNWGAAADARKDIVGALREEFDLVELERCLAGSLFLARCQVA